jgi:NAD(P)-dependent dehydrogenase (short-subunit alcohol dehydrogenase family)
VGKNLGFTNGMKLYAQSKLAQILYTRELAKRRKDEGVDNVTVNSLHPGAVKTNIVQVNGILKYVLDMVFMVLGEHVSQGAYLQTYI